MQIMSKKKNDINPFELFTYRGPKYFCDREDELKALIQAFENRRNIVLGAQRRIGKTSLIQHFQYHLERDHNATCVYVDMLNTRSDLGFINNFATAVINTLEEKEGRVSKFVQMFKNFRPEASFDPISGAPTFSLNIENKQELKFSFDAIMNLLLERKENIQISIDEFQQIENYEEPSMIDATIRSYFPKAKNLHFLFSGSEEHLLSTLFSNPKKPLFSSTEWMNLYNIGYDPYFKFIKENFENNGKRISDFSIHRILKWTNQVTFYTHYICNLLYLASDKEVTEELVNRTMQNCLKQFESSYYYYQKILSNNQYALLKSIAKEGDAKYLTSKTFLNKYNFSASSVKQSLDVLLEKQMVREKIDKNGKTYNVYDVFLARWLATRK